MCIRKKRNALKTISLNLVCENGANIIKNAVIMLDA